MDVPRSLPLLPVALLGLLLLASPAASALRVMGQPDVMARLEASGPYSVEPGPSSVLARDCLHRFLALTAIRGDVRVIALDARGKVLHEERVDQGRTTTLALHPDTRSVALAWAGGARPAWGEWRSSVAPPPEGRTVRTFSPALNAPILAVEAVWESPAPAAPALTSGSPSAVLSTPVAPERTTEEVARGVARLVAPLYQAMSHHVPTASWPLGPRPALPS